MSCQAGIFYFDGHQVPDSETEAVLSWLASSNEEGTLSEHSQHGVFLAQEPSPAYARAITFDGRLDNREDLIARFACAAKISDVALALAAYEKRGLDGLGYLVGDWSLAIWDAARKTVVLASDFAGVRPLYYYVEQNRAAWSTRLQPLADWTGGSDIDEDYAGRFLLSGFAPNRTPYRGLYSVPPGHAVLINAFGARTEQFWKFPIGNTIRYRRESEYEEHLLSLFEEAVRCRLRPGVPAIAELSGGLDSSSIVCMSHHLVQKGVIADNEIVTLSYEHQGSLDTPFYSAVEEFCGFANIHVPAGDYPFLTESDTGGAEPAFWQQLHNRTADLVQAIGARTYLTGKLGDLAMGNWWDDSDQVAGLLRRGRIGTALQQSLAWSKVLHVPIWWILGKAALSNLPPCLNPLGLPSSQDGSYAPRSTEDSIAPAFRRRMRSPDEPAFFSSAWKQAPPDRRKHFRGLFEALSLRKLQAPEPFQHLDYTHPYAHRPLLVFLSSVPPDILCRPGEPRRLMRRAFQPLWPPKLRSRRTKDSFGALSLAALRPLAKVLLEQTSPLQVVERGWVDAKSLNRRLNLMLYSLDSNETQLRQIILLELWLRGRQKQASPPPISGVQRPLNMGISVHSRAGLF